MLGLGLSLRSHLSRCSWILNSLSRQELWYPAFCLTPMALGNIKPTSRLRVDARLCSPFPLVAAAPRSPLSRGCPCTQGSSDLSTYHVLLLSQRLVQTQQVFQVKVEDAQVQVHAEKAKAKQKRLSESLTCGCGYRVTNTSLLRTSHSAS